MNSGLCDSCPSWHLGHHPWEQSLPPRSAGPRGPCSSMFTVSHTHQLVLQGYFQGSRFLVCESRRVEEIVRDAHANHEVIVGQKPHDWWVNGKWAAVSPPEKLPLDGKKRTSLGTLLGLQASPVKDGREPARCEQELPVVWGGHLGVLSSILGLEEVIQPVSGRGRGVKPAPLPHCTTPPPSCQSARHPSKEQLPPLSH